ncbi:MAG TPA: hypothetical protein VNK73_19350 [Actinomycetota bacterium]|nr:hypothetical protein [Actinomycetota bacterium]
MELPDLPGPRLWFVWGPVMGEQEAGAFVSVAAALELAGSPAASCAPAPGAGARPSRRSPAGTWRLPGPELDGRSWLVVVVANGSVVGAQPW